MHSKMRWVVFFCIFGVICFGGFVVAGQLVYSTYLGGASADIGEGITVDNSGNAYITGVTGSTDFPTTGGTLDISFNGGYDVFVTKLNASGTGLVYSTYLGGGIGDYSRSIAVDSSGNAYITGFTNSSDFPTTPGAFDTTINGEYDSFVTKLNANGSVVVYSTFLGGGTTDYGFGIAIDGLGNAYIMGYTLSTNFPTTAGAIDTTYNGGTSYGDVFVSKLNASGSALVYSTYLGGGSEDWGYGIALDSSGNAYITGNTNSTNFPTTAGAYDTTYNGGLWDAFVSKLNASGTALIYSTYLGGDGVDLADRIAVDTAGNAYITGNADPNFPVTAGAYDTSFNGTWDVFVTKLNAGGTALLYSTYLGGSGGDRGSSIAIDSAGNAYITGETNSPNFPTTLGAFDTSYNGGSLSGENYGDGFVSMLNTSGTELVYSTYFGGSADDRGNAIAVDNAGNVYIAGQTLSTNFPITAGAYDTTYNGGTPTLGDVVVIKLDRTQVPVELSLFQALEGIDNTLILRKNE